MQRNTPLRFCFVLMTIAGLLLPASLPHAAPADDQPVAAAPSAEPVPPIGVFNDFEELHWKDEVGEVLSQGRKLSAHGHTNLLYPAFGLVNLALNGNAYAAALLSDSNAFRIYPEAIGETVGDESSPLSSTKTWKAYADELTSPGWAAYLADVAEPRRSFKSGRTKKHPAAIYWRISKKGEYLGHLEIYRVAYERGYAYAQADLSAAYSQAPGSSWVIKKEENWIERKLALAEASAGQGEPYGLYVVGHNYLNGLYGGEPDPENALMYFLLARKAIRQKIRPGALSHPEDDGIILSGIRANLTRIECSSEMIARAEARADQWLAEFLKKREAACAPVRAKRAQLAAAMREKYRDEYIRVYGILKKKGLDLPPNIFEAGI